MSEPLRRLESVHVVRTPEYVEFEFPLAGLMTRFLAWGLDVFVSSVAAAAMTFFVWMLGFLVPGFAMAITFVIWFVANWGYFMGSEYLFAGQTLGKKVLGLRVIQESGVRLGFYHAAVRNLVRAVDHLPVLYLLGGTIAALSSKGRRLGDLAAGTVVVRERSRKIPAGIAKSSDAMLQLGAERRADERVRRASIEERQLIISAALRREELSMEARLALFRSLASYVTERFGVERPEHLSEEKFVVAIAGLVVGSSDSKKPKAPPRCSAAPPVAGAGA